MPKLYKPFDNSSKTSVRDKLSGSINTGVILKKLGISSDATKIVSEGPGWYSYTVVSPQGVRHKGKMQAPSSLAVSEALQMDGWLPLSIAKNSSGGMNTDLGALVGSDKVRLSLKELAAFARRLSEMLKAGVPLTRALVSLGESEGPKFRNLCDSLAEKVSSGVPLSEAMADYPEAFDDIFRSYVAAGESTGTLPLTISRLSKSLERRNAMSQKIKGVTAYPKFIGGIIGLIVIGIIWKLIPQFVSIYDNFDAELPAPTRMLITFSSNVSPITFSLTAPMPWFTEVGLTFIGIIGRVFAIIFLFLLFEFIRIKRGKEQKPIKLVFKVILILVVTVFAADYKISLISFLIWGSLAVIAFGLLLYNESNKENLKYIRRKELLKYKLPLFGELIRLTTIHRWASTLAGALDSGVPMAQSLELAANTTGSAYYKYVSKELQAAVRSGKPLSEGLLSHTALVPSSVRSMIVTGEQTGELAVMLESAASSVDVETDAIIAGLAAKIEVGLLVVMGVVVGGLIIVMYLPILNLAATGFSQGS